MSDKIKETPEAVRSEDRNREMSDKELDKVTGGDHGGSGRRISSAGSFSDRWRWDDATGQFVRRT